MTSMNEKDLAEILESVFGNEVWDDSVEDTAARVLRFWREYVPVSEMLFNLTVFPTKVNQLIVVNDISFSSLCSHHLLPFYGKAHVGYIPNKLAVGLSKIPRTVDHFARRPTTQEILTAQIASFLKGELSPHGVAVVIKSRHTCMSCRGVRKSGAYMTTSEMRGVFLTGPAAKQEFLALI